MIPPLVTPFLPDGRLDLAAFEANLEALAVEDLAGYLVLGSNGEAGSLEEDEKLALVGIARARAGSRTVLVGTGLESTRATVALTRKAADRGADAVLVLTPCYYKARMTVEALQRHFEAVADASPVPVLLYSVPAFTGLPWPPGLAAALAPHPGIAGMKESSGDLGLLGRPALCLGAAGGVLAVANCAPRPAAAIYRAFKAGDHARARRLQEALTPLAVAVTSTHGVAGLKAAMDLAGLRGGHVRAPLLPASPALHDELRPLLDRANAAA